MSLPIGNFGAYRVTSVLGRGGFSTVFACTDDRLQDDVAVKVLADNYAIDPDIRARFISEGRLIRKIDNRHLIKVHDVGETERGQPYLVLELADRGNLGERVAALLSTNWVPSPADVLVVAEAVLDATAALHNNNLVHRDIKPDNVLIRSTNQARLDPGVRLIDNDERLMVSDLGFVKDLAQHSGFTLAGGTARFGAPEQLSGGRVTPQSDLFAVARLLEWLVEPAPEAPWLDRLRSALHPALEPEPHLRPASADDLLQEIRRALADPREATAPDLGRAVERSPEQQLPEERSPEERSPAAEPARTAPPPATPALQTPPLAMPDNPTPIATTHMAPAREAALPRHDVAAIPPPPSPHDAALHRPTPRPPVPNAPTPRSTSRLGVIATAAVLVTSIVVAGVLWLAVRDDGPGLVSEANPTESEVRVRTDIADGPAIEIAGPIETTVDTPISLVASGPADAEFRWTLPDGNVIEDTTEVILTAASPGRATVRLEVLLPDDTTERLTYPYRIVDR